MGTAGSCCLVESSPGRRGCSRTRRGSALATESPFGTRETGLLLEPEGQSLKDSVKTIRLNFIDSDFVIKDRLHFSLFSLNKNLIKQAVLSL